jgi:hypothetical protein
MFVAVARLAKKVDSSLRKGGGGLVAVPWVTSGSCFEGSCWACPGSAAAGGLEGWGVGGVIV